MEPVEKFDKLLEMFDKLLDKFEKKLLKVKPAQENPREQETCRQDCMNV